MAKLLVINGSPTPGSSTELLLASAVHGFESSLPEKNVTVELVVLNELTFIPCQACGKAPTPKFCFYDDSLTSIYNQIAECDAFLLGSPIYFDSVSAQTKAFIDRCNCFRPPDFDNRDPEHDFIKILRRKRPGGLILVGGKDAWFEGARRTVAGFFKWIEVTNEGMVVFRSDDYCKSGMATDNEQSLSEARLLGKQIAERILHG
ncbi:MAG: flavodoxin family protein [Candidatus Zixiibacteriota bacterium]